MFDEAALALRRHLVAAVQKVQDTLDEHLEKVAKKVRRARPLLRAVLDDSSHFPLPDGVGRNAHGGALGVSSCHRGRRQDAQSSARDAPRAQRGGGTLDPGSAALCARPC